MMLISVAVAVGLGLYDKAAILSLFIRHHDTDALSDIDA